MVLLVIGVTACGTRYPLDIPEEQWVLMSPQQQLDARTQQAALDKAAHERGVAEARAREAEALKEAAELDQRRRNAEYGERVQCILDPAEVYVRGRWETARPVALDLVSGFADEIETVDSRGRYAQSFYASFDGQVVRMCRSVNAIQRRSAGECAEMIATRQQYERGITRQIEQDRLIRGDLYCDLVPQAPRGQRLRLH